MFAVSSHAFEVTGDSFTAKWKIDSITVGKLESTINLSSADTGQYGKVYVSYTLTSNPNIPNSGTWIGYGRGISPDGVLARGDLMGVWTMDGTKINIKSVDSVTDGINFLSGTIDLVAGEMELASGLFLFRVAFFAVSMANRVSYCPRSPAAAAGGVVAGEMYRS